MISVLIIEDEAPAYRRLDNLLRASDEDFKIIEVIDSVQDSLKWLRNHAPPDLIFSDIQLSDGLSFEIFKEEKVTCPIIFTTAYDAYMLDAFKTNGIDYLLKPIQQEDLERSLLKYKTFQNQENGNPSAQIDEILKAISSDGKQYKKRFLIRLGDKLIPVSTGEIAYFRYFDGSTELISKSGKKYLVDNPLDELEKQLNPKDFFRLNRQYFASADSIGIIHRYFKGKLKVELTPSPEDEVLVSREKATRFKEWMGDED